MDRNSGTIHHCTLCVHTQHDPTLNIWKLSVVAQCIAAKAGHTSMPIIVAKVSIFRIGAHQDLLSVCCVLRISEEQAESVTAGRQRTQLELYRGISANVFESLIIVEGDLPTELFC